MGSDLRCKNFYVSEKKSKYFLFQVVKRMWAYIKDNKLQDPKNKQFIKCDEKLSKVRYLTVAQ